MLSGLSLVATKLFTDSIWSPTILSFEKYDLRTEVAKVFSQTGGYRAMTSLEKSRDGDINVTIPTVSGSIPIVILMKALGMSKDNEIHDAIFSYREMDPIIYYNIEPETVGIVTFMSPSLDFSSDVMAL